MERFRQHLAEEYLAMEKHAEALIDRKYKRKLRIEEIHKLIEQDDALVKDIREEQKEIEKLVHILKNL